MFQTTHVYYAITNLSKALYLEFPIKQHVSYKYEAREESTAIVIAIVPEYHLSSSPVI